MKHRTLAVVLAALMLGGSAFAAGTPSFAVSDDGYAHHHGGGRGGRGHRGGGRYHNDGHWSSDSSWQGWHR